MRFAEVAKTNRKSRARGPRAKQVLTQLVFKPINTEDGITDTDAKV